ncbi:hypothetical protein [Streptomyces sp. NPDC001404]|uniref:hypothetical protein n=1 Tax=Streptomyces sp. NPDC001404 TaxID=3364571 RepID=UPI0036D11C98
MQKTTRTTVVALGAGATLLSIAGLAATAASASATGPAGISPATVQAADDPKQKCGPLDTLPGGPCSTDELGDSNTQPSRTPSDRNIKTDILQASWTRR